MGYEERKSEKKKNSYKNENISNKRKKEKLNENMSDDLVIKKKKGNGHCRKSRSVRRSIRSIFIGLSQTNYQQKIITRPANSRNFNQEIYLAG